MKENRQSSNLGRQQQIFKNHPIYTEMVSLASDLRQQLIEAIELNEMLLNSILKQPTDRGSTKSGSGNSQENGISEKKDRSPKEESQKEKVFIPIEKKKKAVTRKSIQEQESQYVPFPKEKYGEDVYSYESKEDTKNVVKTIITAICNYLSENSLRVRKLLNERGLTKAYAEFCKYNNKIKNEVSSLADLRRIWSSDRLMDTKMRNYKQIFRIFSFEYLRHQFLSHIFQSPRIKNKKLYMKVRTKLLEGILTPQELCNLKDY